MTCQEDKDPCEGITCMNGGTCINGQCDCPDNYEGPNCSKQKTPKSMHITKIVVTKFPPTEPGGGGWDIDDGADIFIKLDTKENPTQVWQSGYQENANPSTDYSATPDSPIEVEPLTRYTMILFDHDSPDPDDEIGGVEFTPYYDDENGFPEEIDLDPAGGDVAFKIIVTYSF